jgi:Dolichyl-phosphate-mannose-protein mannosyltransferase
MPLTPDHRSSPLATALGALGLTAAVFVIYHSATISYFFNDDFHWLAAAPLFRLGHVVHLDDYTHFYRPVIEIYFHAGRQVFGCDPMPFHVASIVIHLINTLLLFLLARALTGRDGFAWLAALLFCVQPGYTEAVAWVAAITDLLPATWFLLTLWLNLLFLQRRGTAWYLLSLTAFAACLLTHESSAILLPMMIALEVTAGVPRVWRAWLRYVPFALLLAGSLAIAVVVNSRSYLIRDSHYAFGWHAVPHALQYVVSLYVGRSIVPSYYLVAAVMALLLWFGTPRVRFFVIWIFVTLAPVSFFTWGNESRYLYVPAAGFAMLIADLLQQGHAWLATRTSPPTARAALIVVTVVLSARFAVYAEKGSEGYRKRALPYVRYVAAVRQAAASLPAGADIPVSADDVAGFPELYRDPAAQVAMCAVDLHVVVR